MIVTSRAPLRIDLAGAWTDVPIFAARFGGAVVNAAINRYVEGRLEQRETPLPGQDGIRISYHSDLPPGAGLGGSAALNVCWLGLLNPTSEPTDAWRREIAEKSFALEQLLGIMGGRQDQYASAMGGISFLQFGTEAVVEHLNIPPQTLGELEDRLVLCFSGRSRLSSRIHERVWGAFEREASAVTRALNALRSGAYGMRDALISGDLDIAAQLIDESWQNQKALDESVTNGRISELFDAALSAGAISGKACGAGGGGCLLFVAEPGRRLDVIGALTREGAVVIPFKFDFEGLTVERRNA